MKEEKALYTAHPIERAILTVRGQKVILDGDLARIYGVSTKALNQAVKRNRERFPSDFVFQLAPQEFSDLTSQIAISSSKGMRSQFVTASKRNARFLPYAFTEHGANPLRQSDFAGQVMAARRVS